MDVLQFNLLRMNFKNYKRKYWINKVKNEYLLKMVQQDVINIQNLPFAEKYKFDTKEESLEYKNQVLAVTGSEDFAQKLAFLNDAQKWYALYYIASPHGKELEMREIVIEGLYFTYDLLVNATLNHINLYCNEKLEFKDDTFCADENTQNSHIITHVTQSLDYLSALIRSVEQFDHTLAYTSYNKIVENKMFSSYINPYPEFN